MIERPSWLTWALPAATAVLGCLGLSALAAPPAPEPATLADDPHYNAAGFFDVHVCNWPEKPPFFFVLFSSETYQRIAGVTVLAPDGSTLAELDPERYRELKRAGKPDKRVLVTHVPVTGAARDGWYEARVRLKDGTTLHARDYVIVALMPQARGLQPAAGATVGTAVELRWDKVPGATHHMVYVRDLWDDRRVVYSSKPAPGNSVKIPPGVLRPDGWYAWRVHSRDVNGHVILGDFNHGSLSPEQEFYTGSK